MPHVLRVPSDVTLDALQSALAGARPATVAVVFPMGRPCRLAQTETMRSFHAYTTALGKNVVIIGGDEHLRAVAVASGFAAATSLEEWEETQPELRAVTQRGKQTRPLWELTDLTLVSDDWFAVSLPGALDYPYTDEPPPYVKALLTTGASESDVDDVNDGAHPEMAAASADEYDDDEQDARALREAHEHYEDHITTAIRASGGVSRPLHFEIRRLTSHAGPPSDPSTDADDKTHAW